MKKAKSILIASTAVAASLILCPFVAAAGSVAEVGSAAAQTPDAMRRNLAPLTNKEGDVTVTVTPRNIFRDATTWDFEIVIETHTQNLNQDMTKSSVLIDEAGKLYLPVGWDGSPAGGHHRKGLLRFKSLSPLPRSIELQLHQVGGIAKRTFRWRLE